MVLLCYNISKGGVFMILVYTSFGCASCRKVKQWLKDRNIPFVEKNIFTMMLNEKELRMLLRRSENGTDDLISKRSKIIKENNIDIDEMSTTELIQFIQQNPTKMLKKSLYTTTQKCSADLSIYRAFSYEFMISFEFVIQLSRIRSSL